MRRPPANRALAAAAAIAVAAALWALACAPPPSERPQSAPIPPTSAPAATAAPALSVAATATATAAPRSTPTPTPPQAAAIAATAIPTAIPTAAPTATDAELCPPLPDRSEGTYSLGGEPDIPPDEPPVALITADGANGGVAAYGVPYYVNWGEDAAAMQSVEGEDLAELLPPATALGQNPVLRLRTSSRPGMMMVAGFDELEPSDGAPEESVCAWDCLHSGADPCGQVGTDGFVEFTNIHPQVFRYPYISVFAMWSSFPTFENGNLVKGGGRVSANWLFHINGE